MPESQPQPPARRRVAAQQFTQEGHGLARAGIGFPFDAAGARGVAQVQRAAVVVDREHRPGLRRTRLAGLVQPGRDGHRIVGHQRAHPARVGVAQRDVGHLVIHQRGLAAFASGLHTVQDHAVDAPCLRVVVAVGVPLDGTVGVGNEGRRRPVRPVGGWRHGDARDAVLVGEPVAVEPVQAQLRPQPARQALVGRGHRAAVQRHVGMADAAQQARALGVGQLARVGHGDDQVVDMLRLLPQLGLTPAPVSGIVVQVEGAVHAAAGFEAGGRHLNPR